MNEQNMIVQSLNVCIDFNLKKRISEINARTLIFFGYEDILTPPTYSKELFHDIINSQVHGWDNVGHNLLVHENINEILMEIHKFLK